jgi:hypothetical protein
MSDSADAQLRRDLILASALLHAPPPVDRVHANCSRVLRHALMAAGLWSDHLAEHEPAWSHGEDGFPIVTEWYWTLIQLTRETPEVRRLLNGAGNLTTPSGPYFTACWLTPAGRAEAERLLAQHPEWARRLRSLPSDNRSK